MCRRICLWGWCAICFGLGVMVGSCIESWFLCSVGGLVLIFLGLMLMRRR